MLNPAPSTQEIIIISVVCLLPIVLFWKIFKKAGYPGALSLLLYIPVVNLALLIYFAFAKWPIEHKLNAN